MALTIHELGKATQDLWVADRRLWLTADRSEAVEDGDPRAAFLLVAPGQIIPRKRAEELGVMKAPKPEAKQVEKLEDKQAEKTEDKQLAPPVTKSRKKATKKKKTSKRA
jgi:hypothetical protein